MNAPAFLERSRRGKRHAAEVWRVGILCHAPYGYRYVNKQEGGGEARFEIAFEEARIVRAAVCLGRSRTLHEESKCVAACTRLASARRRAKSTPDHKTIWDMLKNPAGHRRSGIWQNSALPQLALACAHHAADRQSSDVGTRGELPAIRRVDYHPRASPGGCCLVRGRPNAIGRESVASADSREGFALLLAGLARLCQMRVGELVAAPMMRAMPITAVQERCISHGRAWERVCWNKELRMDQTDAVV
jgi:hypothetical protein